MRVAVLDNHVQQILRGVVPHGVPRGAVASEIYADRHEFVAFYRLRQWPKHVEDPLLARYF